MPLTPQKHFGYRRPLWVKLKEPKSFPKGLVLLY